MQRWLMIGFACSFFWMFIEPHIYRLLWFVRYTLFLGLRKPHQAKSEGGMFLKAFMTGFIACLIIFLWPFYLVAAAARFIHIFASTPLVKEA